MSRASWAKALKKHTKSNQVVTGYKSNVQGWRTIGGNKCYFRSLWEIQFAQYLEWLRGNRGISLWEYEPRLFTFPRDKYRAGPFEYLPDFRVTENNGNTVWYEVKGYMNAASKKKITRLKKHYPQERIEIIGKPWFMSARKKKLHLIIGWEKLPTSR